MWSNGGKFKCFHQVAGNLAKVQIGYPLDTSPNHYCYDEFDFPKMFMNQFYCCVNLVL